MPKVDATEAWRCCTWLPVAGAELATVGSAWHIAQPLFAVFQAFETCPSLEGLWQSAMAQVCVFAVPARPMPPSAVVVSDASWPSALARSTSPAWVVNEPVTCASGVAVSAELSGWHSLHPVTAGASKCALCEPSSDQPPV